MADHSDVSIELLKALGVEDGHPANLQTAIDAGMEVEFHMAMDEYNGVSAVKVKYINPVRNQIDVKDANWAEIIAKYEAKDATEETKKPEPTVAPPKTKEDGTVEKKDEAEKTEADFINSEKKDDGALEVDKIPF